MLTSRKFSSGLAVLTAAFISWGCDVNTFSFASEPSQRSTHRHVPMAPRLTKSNPVLLVGLQAYLGQGIKETFSASELRLVSAGAKPLVLKDADGLVHKSSQITIKWRKVPLQAAQKFSRQVLGPFSSYESAQRVFLKLNKNQKESAVIARPKDWEVWLVNQGPLLNNSEAFTLTTLLKDEIRPVLRGTGGELLLSGPIQIEAPEGLLWKGGVYWGPFSLKPDAYGTWTFVEHVPLERYLQGVVPHEIGSGSPSAALSAQAVLARTWALANSKRFSVDGYHLCSDTQCQVYKDPSKASSRIKSSIINTAGKILRWKGKPINAVYHASNGGVSAAGTEAWAIDPLPYLRSYPDGSVQWNQSFRTPLDNNRLKEMLQRQEGANGTKHPRFRWARKVSSFQFKTFLLPLRKSAFVPETIKVLERGPSGRVVALEIGFPAEEPPIILKLDEIRRYLTILPSTLFVVNKVGEETWEFLGGGFGHGAGLSQAGAIDLAQQGWSPKQILKYYYPGTTYGSLLE